MKKLISGMLFVAAMGLSFSGSMANAQSLGGEQDCEESIDIDGETITVTVCGRKTNLWGFLDGNKCNAVATTSCTFTN
ncbi:MULTISPECIES: hypothetical protein [Algoriphagus]|uniref:hypothetical protein n=1 Tax=Algoriphagus TaxID=246875 RepID=UPI00094BA694|nr:MULTISPECIES: hypothetical protein [Algoriphagus]MDG1278987.1 hypothetical protein [Algoriphagus sp.]